MPFGLGEDLVDTNEELSRVTQELSEAKAENEELKAKLAAWERAGLSGLMQVDDNDPAYKAGYDDGRAALEIALGPGAIEHHLKAIVINLGLDPSSQHFANTPARVAKVLRAYVQPIDLEEVLSGGFEDDDETAEKTLVVQTPIPFMGLCAHHLLPFFGAAAVGYLPRDRVVGLSKLTRLVYAAGHVSPTTQEHITNLIADALFNSKGIQPRAVAVLTSALHGCMAVRGVESPSTRTLTTALRGPAFLDSPALETKFMTMAMEGFR